MSTDQTLYLLCALFMAILSFLFFKGEHEYFLRNRQNTSRPVWQVYFVIVGVSLIFGVIWPIAVSLLVVYAVFGKPERS